MVPEHLSADTEFDTVFNTWQEQRQKNLVEEFEFELGLDSQLLAKSIKAYDLKIDGVLFREDIVKTLDVTKAQINSPEVNLNST